MSSSALKIEALAGMVQEKLTAESIGLRAAAEQCGVSSATLSRVAKGNVPDTASFAAIVRWLGVPADLFIARDHEPSSAEIVEAHLRADRTLPPDTARALSALVKAAYKDYSSESKPSA